MGRPLGSKNKGYKGRPAGAKNKAGSYERAYQRCLAKNYHPADTLIEIASDESNPKEMRIRAAAELMPYMEGRQRESPPIRPLEPSDSLEAAKAAMEHLAELSKPIIPAPSPERSVNADPNQS